jgi:hypothetical protein
MESVGNGRYVLAVGALPEGTYKFDATARRNAVTLGTDTGEFAVGALTLEFKETQADVPLLRQVAARSDGRFLTADEAPELARTLEASGTFTASFVEEQRETELWHVYVFFIIVLALLSIEWFLRKRSGMV